MKYGRKERGYEAEKSQARPNQRKDLPMELSMGRESLYHRLD